MTDLSINPMDDLEVVSTWGKDHYSIGEQPECYCLHSLCRRCWRWRFCPGLRACHNCGEGI